MEELPEGKFVMKSNKEIWKDIPNYPRYQASTSGRIRSNYVQGPGTTIGPWHVLKNSPMSTGYLRVSICAEGKNHTHTVHRLVLITFRGLPRLGQVTRHLDGDPINNILSNLKWGTYRQNSQDRDRHGKTSRGEMSTQAKLKEADVIRIRKLLAAGQTQAQIGRLFGINRRSIGRILHGETWKHITLKTRRSK